MILTFLAALETLLLLWTIFSFFLSFSLTLFLSLFIYLFIYFFLSFFRLFIPLSYRRFRLLLLSGTHTIELRLQDNVMNGLYSLSVI